MRLYQQAELRSVPGPRLPQTAFAFESQLDIIAHALKIDPLEIRRKNGLREGDLSFIGKRLESSSFQEVLQRVARQIAGDQPLEAENRAGAWLATKGW